MGSRIIIFSLVFGLLVLIIPAFLALGIKMIPNDFQASFDDSQKVYKDREISQNFIADKDYLSGLGVSIRNLNLMNKKDVVMSLRKENNLIREVALNGGVIGDGQLVKFIFDPITDSKGQTYKVVFSAGDSNIDEALEIFLTKSFPGASVTIGKEIYQESLAGVLYYRPQSKLLLVSGIYQGWLQKFLSDLPFAIFYTLLILLGLGYLVVKRSDTITPN